MQFEVGKKYRVSTPDESGLIPTIENVVEAFAAVVSQPPMNRGSFLRGSSDPEGENTVVSTPDESGLIPTFDARNVPIPESSLNPR